MQMTKDRDDMYLRMTEQADMNSEHGLARACAHMSNRYRQIYISLMKLKYNQISRNKDSMMIPTLKEHVTAITATAEKDLETLGGLLKEAHTYADIYSEKVIYDIIELNTEDLLNNLDRYEEALSTDSPSIIWTEDTRLHDYFEDKKGYDSDYMSNCY